VVDKKKPEAQDAPLAGKMRPKPKRLATKQKKKHTDD